ncbi:26S proteasome non-ATPase regulatory subunit 4 [Coccidioides immitis RMSCC 3703]|uniref:26S proteasome non-ATPase regulatory subunit 4 n=1 Tax=Coccidioides immitis RMSCC 3703 TaxID=454286 RepID=A0A0J8U398_COCIT|nr:26S proteasome non-ATPase regulatory subunit 4 [Coccidioides immitis RMSCC 3703]
METTFNARGKGQQDSKLKPDAINLVHSAKDASKTQSPQSGLMSMGGKGPEGWVTFTVEIWQILEGLHRTKIRGNAHLSSSIQVAHLALKHRKERAQRQRIIVFTCSPISEDEKTLVKLAKKMKKHNVNVDFVAFGDLDSDTVKKLEAFHENVNSGNGSHLEIIHPGPNLLSDSLVATPIIGGEGMGGREGEEGANGFEFGIDPSADPELAFALRMSLEEEKARQEKEKQEKEKDKASLEGIPEESQPLLNQSGEPSGSNQGPPGDNRKDKGDDGDKMDTS